jgi:hypothetical protein
MGNSHGRSEAFAKPFNPEVAIAKIAERPLKIGEFARELYVRFAMAV